MMSSALKIIRVIPDEELFKLKLPVSEEFIYLLTGLNDHEYSLNTVFNLTLEFRSKEEIETFTENITLKEVYLYESLIDVIPIGIRVVCKFSISAVLKKRVHTLSKDEDNYLIKPFDLHCIG